MGVPPLARSDGGVPEEGYPLSGYPPTRSDGGYLRWGTPHWGTPPIGIPPQLAGPGRGTPPPPFAGVDWQTK